MSDEKDSGFKVTDRRLFNPDGSLREDVIAREEAQAVEVPKSAPAAGPAPAPLREHLEPEGGAAVDDAMPEQTMFTEFLMGIASSAFIYLGLVEHPATGRRQVDMMAARESIDMISMLREKTKGNLTRGEEKFFDDLLSDLRMQFVALRQRQGQ